MKFQFCSAALGEMQQNFLSLPGTDFLDVSQADQAVCV